MTRFFVDMEEAINLCKFACKMMEGGETFVLDMGVAKVIDIANEIIKKFGEGEIKEIGPLPGEKLYEELYTDVEGQRTVLSDGIYVILPEKNNINDCFSAVLEKYKKEKKIGVALRSDNQNIKKANIKSLVNSLLKD